MTALETLRLIGSNRPEARGIGDNAILRRHGNGLETQPSRVGAACGHLLARSMARYQALGVALDDRPGDNDRRNEACL